MQFILNRVFWFNLYQAYYKFYIPLRGEFCGNASGNVTVQFFFIETIFLNICDQYYDPTE